MLGEQPLHQAQAAQKPGPAQFSVPDLLAIYPVFAWVAAARSATALACATMVLSALSCASAGPVYASMTEGLPRQIRSGTFGTIYATAVALFGGTTQLVVT